LTILEWKDRDVQEVKKIALHDEFEHSKNTVSMKPSSNGAFLCLFVSNNPNEVKVVCIESQNVYTYACTKAVIDLFWDAKCPNFLVCHLSQGEDMKKDQELLSLFVGTNQLIFKDTQTVPAGSQQLVSVSLPYVIYKRVDE
jgi:hypothetical protein